jgi:Domain of unknown function (DUF4142)
VATDCTAGTFSRCATDNTGRVPCTHATNVHGSSDCVRGRKNPREFQKEAADGKDAQAKAFAAATLPTLKMHLQKIQSIAAAAGIKD